MVMTGGPLGVGEGLGVWDGAPPPDEPQAGQLTAKTSARRRRDIKRPPGDRSTLIRRTAGIASAQAAR
jgi:hypothetical protein